MKKIRLRNIFLSAIFPEVGNGVNNAVGNSAVLFVIFETFAAGILILLHVVNVAVGSFHFFHCLQNCALVTH